MALESVARAIRDDEIAQKIISTLLPPTLLYLINVSYLQSVVKVKIKKQRPYSIEKIRNNPHLKIRNKTKKSFFPMHRLYNGWQILQFYDCLKGELPDKLAKEFLLKYKCTHTAIRRFKMPT